MLIKVGERWIDASTITSTYFTYDASRNGTYYALYVCDTKGCCSCGHYKAVIRAAVEKEEEE